LFSSLQDNNTLAGAGNSTGYTDNTQFGVDQSDLQVLDGHFLVAHLTGHLLSLKNFLRVHAADRTDTAIAAATVRLAAAVEVVALDSARPALTLAVAGDVHSVAN